MKECSQESNECKIDSGRSNHMTKDSRFIQLDTLVKTPIRLGNEVVVKSSGKGTIAIETYKGVKHIKEVLHVLDLSKNLISVSQLMRNGYIIQFQGNTCSILNPSRIEIASIPIKDKSFVLNWSYASHHAHKAKADEIYWLWHKRLYILKHFINFVVEFGERSSSIE